jgi:hypothetical protein
MALQPSPSEAELTNLNDTGRLAVVIDQLRLLNGSGSSSKNMSDDTATQIKTGAGILSRVVVSKASSAKTMTLYDGTANTDPVLAVVDLSAVNSLQFGLPFSDGLYAEFTADADANVTVIYS